MGPIRRRSIGRVGPRRRGEGAEPGQEGVGGHLDVGGPEAVGLFEVQADPSVGGALHGAQVTMSTGTLTEPGDTCDRPCASGITPPPVLTSMFLILLCQPVWLTRCRLWPR